MWPGRTWRSPSSCPSRRREAIIFSMDPPGKSVRPQEPAKRVSPQNSTSPHRRVTEPSLWPGVARTDTVRPPTATVSPSS